jgi:hypothetical protein
MLVYRSITLQVYVAAKILYFTYEKGHSKDASGQSVGENIGTSGITGRLEESLEKNRCINFKTQQI